MSLGEVDGLLVLLAVLNVPDLLPDGDEGIHEAVQLSLQETQSRLVSLATNPGYRHSAKGVVICQENP